MHHLHQMTINNTIILSDNQAQVYLFTNASVPSSANTTLSNNTTTLNTMTTTTKNNTTPTTPTDNNNTMIDSNELSTVRKVCENPKCLADKTPLWRKGWKDSNSTGRRVRLCNACGLHFRKGHYCKFCFEIYKDASELEGASNAWILCDKCDRWVHQRCAISHGARTDREYICDDCSQPANNKQRSSSITSDRVQHNAIFIQHQPPTQPTYQYSPTHQNFSDNRSGAPPDTFQHQHQLQQQQQYRYHQCAPPAIQVENNNTTPQHTRRRHHSLPVNFGYHPYQLQSGQNSPVRRKAFDLDSKRHHPIDPSRYLSPSSTSPVSPVDPRDTHFVPAYPAHMQQQTQQIQQQQHHQQFQQQNSSFVLQQNTGDQQLTRPIRRSYTYPSLHHHPRYENGHFHFPPQPNQHEPFRGNQSPSYMQDIPQQHSPSSTTVLPPISSLLGHQESNPSMWNIQQQQQQQPRFW
jgi:hypothetical protein